MDIVKISALILITLFYISYFVKQLMLRRRGITANRLAKGVKPKKTMLIETVLLVMTYTMAVIQYASVIFEFNFTAPVVLRIIGVCLMFAGVGFFICAVTVMRDNWRAGIDKAQSTGMVTSGIYGISRNPAFLGFDLLYFGTVLAYPNIVIIIGTVVSVVFFHLQILEEEKFLADAFGKEYAEYKKRTGRYFLML